MASYEVIFKPSVERDLRKLPKSIVVRVLKAIDVLKAEPFQKQALKLEGAKDLFRVRVGDYRVVYEVDRHAKKLIVHHVRHRREVYRNI